MNKKGLFITLALTVIFSVGLAIYTLISVLGVTTPAAPTNITVAAVYRTRDEIKEISTFDSNSMTITFENEKFPAIALDKESGKYFATNAGKATVVVNLDDLGNKKTYNIEVVNQLFDEENNPKDNVAITSREHLIEYANLTRLTKASATNYRGYNVTLYNDIDLAGINWLPIGTTAKPFYGTFNGNGHTIKGLSIHVTSENVTEFLSTVDGKVSMYVGLFGCVDGATVQDSFAVKGEVKNVSFDSAYIKIDSEARAAIEEYLVKDTDNVRTFTQSGIGIIAGGVKHGIIDGGENRSTLTNCKIDGYAPMIGDSEIAGVGGLVGIAFNDVSINNYNININIDNDYAAASKVDGEGVVLQGNLVGGVAGAVLNSATYGATDQDVDYILQNCDVNVVATIKSNNRTRFGGATAILSHSIMENVNVVADVRTNDSDKTNDEVYYSKIGGAAFLVVGSDSKIISTTVKIDSDVHARTSGFVYQNEGTIKNSSVKNSYIKSYYTNGFAHFNDGTIEYTEEFKGEAVDNVTLRGFVNSGFVYENTGIISGFAKDEEYTKISVTINSRNALFKTVAALKVYENTVGSAGFANISTGTIQNFDVNVIINNDVNQAGLVFNLGKYGATDAAILSNMKVNATLASVLVKNNGAEVSTTKYMAGAVARMFKAEIQNVDVVVNANKDAILGKEYGVEFFGGIVARILEDGAIINNSSVTGYAYFNTSYYKMAFAEDTEKVTYQVSLIGGLVGAIAGDGLSATNGQYTDEKQDQFLNVNTVGVQITNNAISDLTLVVNLGNNDIVEAGNKTENRWRARALGVTIGSANNSIALDLSSNTATNVTIKTIARDYNYTTSTSDNNSALSDSNKSYGSAFVATDANKDIDLTGVKYVEL